MIKKILIVKNRAMGDAVIGLGAVQFLKQQYPNAQIFYGVPKWVLPLFNETSTSADCIIPLSFRGLFDWWKMLLFMWREQFDLVYEMNQSGRSGKFFAAAKKVMGFRYFYHNHNYTDETIVFEQGVKKPNIQRDLDGLWSALCLLLQKRPARPNYLNYIPQMKWTGNSSNRVTLGVVATRETKMWPLENFVKLAHHLVADFSCEIIIPLSSSLKDQSIRKELEELGLPQGTHFVVAPLNELPAELGASRLYIGNDTGLKHISIALGVPSISFFGPEQPLEWHPYDQGKHPYFFIDGLDCRTKDAHFCGLETCNAKVCMEGISVDCVYEKSRELLG